MTREGKDSREADLGVSSKRTAGAKVLRQKSV